MLGYYFLLSALLSLLVYFTKKEYLTKVIVSIFLFATVAIGIYAYFHINQVDTKYYRFDAIGVLLGLILSILTIPTIYHSYLYLKRNHVTEKQKSIYYAALILFIYAMMSAFYAENVALLWVSVEATTLFVSVLIYFKRLEHALEATWKYLYVSSVGLAISFIGILFLSIIASDNGLDRLNFIDLTALAQQINPLWLKIAFVLILTGFSIKMSVFPLFAASIDAKTILVSPVNALMSTALVNVGFIGVFRVYCIISKTAIQLWAQHILILVGVLSIFIAGIQLSRVKRLKRMYAFSSMEHLGIVLVGLGIGGIGYYATVLHLVFHSFVKAGLFYQVDTIQRFSKSKWLKDMGDYFKLNTVSALVFILGVISILAIPPSGLFISEFYIFKQLFISHHYLIAIFILLILTLIIYWFTKNTFHILFSEVNDFNHASIKPNLLENIFPLLFFVLVIYLGMNPPFFFTNLIHQAIALLN